MVILATAFFACGRALAQPPPAASLADQLTPQGFGELRVGMSRSDAIAVVEALGLRVVSERFYGINRRQPAPWIISVATSNTGQDCVPASSRDAPSPDATPDPCIGASLEFESLGEQSWLQSLEVWVIPGSGTGTPDLERRLLERFPGYQPYRYGTGSFGCGSQSRCVSIRLPESLQASGPRVLLQRGRGWNYAVTYDDSDITADMARRRVPPAARFRDLELGMEAAAARAALDRMGLTVRAAPSPPGQPWVHRLVASSRGLRCEVPRPPVDPCIGLTLDLAPVGQGSRRLITFQVAWQARDQERASAMLREVVTPLGVPDRELTRRGRDEAVWEQAAQRAGSTRILRWLQPSESPALAVNTVIYEDRELARQARLAAASPPRGRR